MNQRRYGIILSYFDLLVHILAGLLFFPFMLRMLGQEEYGLYAIATSLAGYLLMMDLGIGNGIVRYISRFRAHRDERSQESFLFLIFILYFMLSVMIIISALILGANIPGIFSRSLDAIQAGRLKIIFCIYITGFAFSFFSSAFTGILKAHERFIFINLSSTARQLLRVFILVIILCRGHGIIAVAVAETSLAVFFSLANGFYVFFMLKIRVKYHRLDKRQITGMLRYSVFIFLMVIADEIYWKLDNIILGIMANAGLVAVYAVGLKLCMYYVRFSTAVTRVFFPKIVYMVENEATGDRLTGQMIQTGRMQALVLWLISTGFIFFGRDFIILWAGKGYIKAYGIALLIMIPLSVFLTQNLGIHILQAKDRHPFRCLVMLAVSLLNIILTIILVKRYGIIGAAIATSAGLALGNILILNLYYHKKIGLDIPRFYLELARGIVPCLALASIPGIILSVPESLSWPALFLKIAVYTTVYAVLMWFFALNKKERKLIADTLVVLKYKKSS